LPWILAIQYAQSAPVETHPNQTAEKQWSDLLFQLFGRSYLA
jgi:hypothetical protein